MTALRPALSLALAALLAPAALAQPRVSRTVEVPAPTSGDYERAAAFVDAAGGVVLAVPFGVFLSVTRSLDGAQTWSRSTDDDLGAYTRPALHLAPDGDGVALGIARTTISDSRIALGLRLGPDGAERARTEVSPTLPADIRSNPSVIGTWSEETYGLLPIEGGDWLAIHAGETRVIDDGGDSTGVEVLVASRITASGEVAWSGGLHVAPTLVDFDPGETAGRTVARGPRATLPIDMTAYIGTASQSAILDLDLAAGTPALAAGFETFGTGYDGTRPGTTFFGATPSGRRVRVGYTGEQNSFTDRRGRTTTNTEWFVEADGMERASAFSVGGPDPDVACDWGGDIALLSTRWAENYQRKVDIQVIAADGTIGRREEVASVSISDAGTFTHRVLACGEVGDALRVIVAGSYRSSDGGSTPSATVTAYDLVR